MMVRQMKEDAKGKSEEELAECFRIFDRCAGTWRLTRAGPGGGGQVSGGRGNPGNPRPAPRAPTPQERGRLHRRRGAGRDLPGLWGARDGRGDRILDERRGQEQRRPH